MPSITKQTIFPLKNIEVERIITTIYRILKWIYHSDNIESERRWYENIKTLLNHMLLALKCKILSDKQRYDAQIRNPEHTPN